MHHVDYKNQAFRVESYKGDLFLKGTRQKTQEEFMVKLLEPAQAIFTINSSWN